MNEKGVIHIKEEKSRFPVDVRGSKTSVLKLPIKKWGSPSLFLSYKCLKLKLRVFLEGHIVTMVTYCATKLTASCSPMIGQFVDTMMLASTRQV